MNRIRAVILHMGHSQLACDEAAEIVMTSAHMVEHEALGSKELLDVSKCPI